MGNDDRRRLEDVGGSGGTGMNHHPMDRRMGVGMAKHHKGEDSFRSLKGPGFFVASAAAAVRRAFVTAWTPWSFGPWLPLPFCPLP